MHHLTDWIEPWLMAAAAEEASRGMQDRVGDFVCFAAWASLVVWLLSRNWRSFARKYRAPAGMNPVGKMQLPMRPAYWVAFLKEGIYIEAPFPIRFFVPSLLVPWASVWQVNEKRGFPWYWRHLHVEINEEAGMIDLRVPMERAQDFYEHYDPEARARKASAETGSAGPGIPTPPHKNQ